MNRESSVRSELNWIALSREVWNWMCCVSVCDGGRKKHGVLFVSSGRATETRGHCKAGKVFLGRKKTDE